MRKLVLRKRFVVRPDQCLCSSPSSVTCLQLTGYWETGRNMLAGESLVNLKQAEAALVRYAIADSQVFLIVWVVQSLGRVQLFVTPWMQPTRVLCPWDFPDKNTGVGCHFLLYGIFPTQESNLSPALQVDSLPAEPLAMPNWQVICQFIEAWRWKGNGNQFFPLFSSKQISGNLKKSNYGRKLPVRPDLRSCWWCPRL